MGYNVWRRANSSVGQSASLTQRRSGVRAPLRPPWNRQIWRFCCFVGYMWGFEWVVVASGLVLFATAIKG